MLFLFTPEDSTEGSLLGKEERSVAPTGQWQGLAKTIFWIAAGLALAFGLAQLH